MPIHPRQPSPKEYSKLVQAASRKTKWYCNLPKAFIIGGTICLIGEGITQFLMAYHIPKEEAGTWTSVVLVFLSALLTGLGLYEKIAKHGGAGTLVPITGFANAVSSAAVEAKTEGFILGVGTKIFTIAGPVILYGTTASVIYGLLYWLAEKL
ncbi:MAG: stage V sporulation protein AC [Oscillospiraceae bacterium]|nr:stage V sporulation protein AC [Ruminococcus sp.]MBQ4346085.1 stage V sporulation protein AC [Oscillospiraceae bacterium]